MKKNFKKVILISLPIILFFPMIVLAQWNLGDIRGFGLPEPIDGIEDIMSNLMDWMLGLIGFIAIMGFLISGFIYFTAVGDEDRAKKAKRAMLYSIIGVVVALGGYVIWRAVGRLLEGNSTHF